MMRYIIKIIELIITNCMLKKSKKKSIKNRKTMNNIIKVNLKYNNGL